MASVQVVLKENVPDVGSIGDVVRVRRGFARNYLLPRGLAVVATRSTMALVEHEKGVQAARATKLRAEQQKLIDSIQKVSIVVAKEATDDGKLYGSVSAADIADALKQRGHDVSKDQIVLPSGNALKDVGSHTVTLKFPYNMSAEIKVDVKTRS